FLRNEGLFDEKGNLVVDPFTLQSLKRGYVFIGGDVRKVGFMIEAIKEGKVAADSIERYLKGMNMREGRKRDYEGYGLPSRISYKPEVKTTWIPPEKRMHFQLIEKSLSIEEARKEAKRCLTCCISIGFEKSLYSVDVDEERCSGCGLCVYACNYDSAHLKIKDGKLVSSTDMFRCKSCGMCAVACPSNARKLVDDDTEQRIENSWLTL
ncbi:MAG: 4Fe-4S binding protein, partial [Chloroflexi bacterium]|nr:4Fe-4S binding protein [Chloroflexota bacterium]